MRRGARGVTLIEALVACVVFLGMLGVTLAVFDYALRGSLQATTRADLQTQATRALTSLQGDLRRSSDDSVVLAPRTVSLGGESLRRDGVCFLGRADWTGPGSYDLAAGCALYDRYFNYYASTTGKLVRAVLGGPSPPVRGTFGLLSYSLALYGNDDPGLNTDQVGFSVLAEGVREFAVAQIDSRRVQARLWLEQFGGRSVGGGRALRRQSYEMILELRPANTVGY